MGLINNLNLNNSNAFIKLQNNNIINNLNANITNQGSFLLKNSEDIFATKIIMDDGNLQLQNDSNMKETDINATSSNISITNNKNMDDLSMSLTNGSSVFVENNSNIGAAELNLNNSTAQIDNNSAIDSLDITGSNQAKAVIINDGTLDTAKLNLDKSTAQIGNNSAIDSLDITGSNQAKAVIINDGSVDTAKLNLNNSSAQIDNNSAVNFLDITASNQTKAVIVNDGTLDTAKLNLNNSTAQIGNNAAIDSLDITGANQAKAVIINDGSVDTADIKINNSILQLQNNADFETINLDAANLSSAYIDNNDDIENLNANIITGSAFQIDNEGALIQRNYLDTTTINNTYNTNTVTTNNYYSGDEVYTVDAKGSGAAYGLGRDIYTVGSFGNKLFSKAAGVVNENPFGAGYMEVRKAANDYAAVANGYSKTVDNTNYTYNNGVGTYTVYGAGSGANGVNTTTSSTTSLTGSTSSTNRALTDQQTLDKGGVVNNFKVNAESDAQVLINNEADQFKDIFNQNTITNDIFTTSSSVVNNGTGGTGSKGNYVVKMINMGTGNWNSPIVIDLNGDGVKTTTAKDGILFDIDGDDKLNQTAWAAGGDAVIAFDADGDGNISSGKELFGEHSDFNNDGVEDGANGFNALAQFDKDNDGTLRGDELAGIKAIVNGEVKSLSDVGITKISVNSIGAQYMDADTNGNIYLDGEGATVNGQKSNIADVWFNNIDTILNSTKENGFKIAS